MSLKFITRPGRETDHPFVFSSFLKSYRSAVNKDLVGDGVFFRVMHKQLERLLGRDRLIVAVVDGDEDEILGWALGGDAELHYVYTKKSFRGKDVATGLIEDLVGDKAEDRAEDKVKAIWYTFHGPGAEGFFCALEARRPWRFRYSPREA